MSKWLTALVRKKKLCLLLFKGLSQQISNIFHATKSSRSGDLPSVAVLTHTEDTTFLLGESLTPLQRMQQCIQCGAVCVILYYNNNILYYIYIYIYIYKVHRIIHSKLWYKEKQRYLIKIITTLKKIFVQLGLVWFGCVLWLINTCGLFDTKSYIYIYIYMICKQVIYW